MARVRWEREIARRHRETEQLTDRLRCELETMRPIERTLERIARFDANRGRLDASPAPTEYKLNSVGGS